MSADYASRGTAAGAQTASLSFGAVIPAQIATILSWDSIAVSTAGTLGPSGSVTSSATLTNVNKANPTNVPSTGGEPLTADSLASTCTASEAPLSGSTTITNGKLRTDSGLQLNDDDDYTDPEVAPVDVTLPVNPDPNTGYTGVIRFSTTSVDNFRVTFSEQVVGPGRAITVNAAHYFFGTPGLALVGEMIVGQSVCGVTLVDLPTTTTTSTTHPSGVCEPLRQGRALFNAQIDASTQRIEQRSFPRRLKARILAQLEAARARINAAFDRALAAAGCATGPATAGRAGVTAVTRTQNPAVTALASFERQRRWWPSGR